MKLFCAAIVFAMLAVGPARAMPILPLGGVPDVEPANLVEVATKSQKAYGYRSCKRKFGSRLAYVTFRGSNFICHFRQSNKQLTKNAARSCRKSGMTLKRVTSIKIKGNKSVTRFICAR